MSSIFNELRIADAQIVGFRTIDGNMEVSLLDWREAEVTILFTGVVGLISISPENVELSEVREALDDPFLSSSCRAVEEPTDGKRCYQFVSAWDDRVVLSIIAEAAVLKP